MALQSDLADKYRPVWLFPLFAFAVVVPWSIGAGSVASGLVLVFALVRLLMDRQRLFRPSKIVVWTVVLYFGVHALATAFSAPYPRRWDKWGEELWLKLLILAVPILVDQPLKDMPRIIKGLILSGAAVGVYATIQHFTGRDYWHGTPLETISGSYIVAAFFSHHLSYGGQVMILFLLAVAWLFVGGSQLRRPSLPALLSSTLLAAALVWSLARSSWIGAMVGLLTLVLLQKGKARRLGYAGILGVLVLLAAVPSVRSRFSNVIVTQETRWNLWKSTIDGIEARPLLGHGPGNFGYLMENHGVEGFYDTKAHAHNDFLMHGSNAGLLGIAAAFLLLFVVTLRLWRARDVSPQVAWLIQGCIAVQVALSLAGLFQVYQTDDEVEMVLYFALGGALAVANMARRRNEDHTAE